MRRTIGKFLRIDVALHAVSVQRVARWRWPGRAPAGHETLVSQSITPSGEHPFDAIANALRALLGELDVAGWPVRFVLAKELTRMWRVTPPAGAARMADLEAAAGLRFQSLYGEPPSAWLVSADWDVVHPFFAAAVPRALLASLHQAARDCGLAMVAAEPYFVNAWNRCRRRIQPGAWFCVLHEHVLTLAPAEADGKGVRAIRPLPVPAGAGQQWLLQTVLREALLLDMEAPSLLQVYGAAPAAWTRPEGDVAQLRCVVLGGA